jgi:hypothetical protein
MGFNFIVDHAGFTFILSIETKPLSILKRSDAKLRLCEKQ